MRSLKRTIILSILIILLATPNITAQEVNLNTPIRHSYPFVYWEDSQLKGMHIDIVTDALNNLGYEVQIEGYPLNRCIRRAEKKEVDGIISVPYDSTYDNILSYPPDAGEAQESKWRIMQVDNVVITDVNSDYEFRGEVSNLPSPIRIIYGRNVVEKNLVGSDARIEKVKTNLQNFKKLLRDEKGVLITTTVTAENMYQDPRFKDEIRIHHIPLTSLSHHLAFSQDTEFTAEERREIWDEIAKLRKDYAYMLQLYAQY